MVPWLLILILGKNLKNLNCPPLTILYTQNLSWSGPEIGYAEILNPEIKTIKKQKVKKEDPPGKKQPFLFILKYIV